MSSQVKMIFKFLFFAFGICSARTENELERSARSIFIDKVVIENSSDEFIRVYIEVRKRSSLLEDSETGHQTLYFSRFSLSQRMELLSETKQDKHMKIMNIKVD